MIAAKTSQIGFTALLGCLGYVAAAAQRPIQPVSWSISTDLGASTRPGSHLTLDVTAHIQAGWHVYAFNQAEGGPTPLHITVDPNGIMQQMGTPTGTLPIKKHDTSFDLDTEIFDHLFTLHVPVLVKLHAVNGSEDAGLSVRFQACNDHICLPPKTVHLAMPVKNLDTQGKAIE